VEGITGSASKELLMYGIEMVLNEPGPIKAQIWKKSMDPMLDKFSESAYYQVMKRSEEKFAGPSIAKALSSEKTAMIIFKEFLKKRSRSRVVIMNQRLKNWTIPRLLPTRLLDKILGKALGLIK